MGNIEEAWKRVEAALDSFNTMVVDQGGVQVTLRLDRYDYGLTHLNQEAKRHLSNTTERFGAGSASEDEIKNAIKAVRDNSEVGHIDFNIRVLEPRPPEFHRMQTLFGREAGTRVIPVRDEAERLAYLDEKVRLALDMAMTYRIVPSDKLLKQFSNLMARTKERSPELLKTAMEYESFNPYKKRREVMPVTLEGFTAPAEPVQEQTIETADNSDFEAREEFARPMPFKLAPKMAPQPLSNGAPSESTAPEPVTPTAPLPHYPEFDEYCERLYEKTYGVA